MTQPISARRPSLRSLSRRSLLRTVATGAATLVGAASHATAALPDGRRIAPTPLVGRVPALVFAVADSHVDAVQPLVDDYCRQRNVPVDVRPTPVGNLLEALTINLSQGTGAYDIVSLEDPWLPAFADGEYLANLDALREARGIAPDLDFVPGLLALGEFPAGTGLRALPWIGNVQLFARRGDLLGELGLAAPPTWDDVLANARAIDAARGASGRFGFGLRGRSGSAAAVGFLPVLRGYGGELFDEAWQPRLGTPPAMRAMETHLALAALAPPEVAKVGRETNERDLLEGIIVQSADVWPDQLLTIGDPAATGAGALEIGAEPAQPGLRPATMTGAWLLGISAGSLRTEAALDFVLWLTAPAQQKRLLLDGPVPPTRSSVLGDAEAVARFPFLPALHDAARDAVPRPRTPYYAEVEAILGGAVVEALAGRLSGEAALRGADAEIRAYLVREGVIDE